MFIKLIKEHYPYPVGRNLQVTNQLGRQLVSEGKAIEVSTLTAITAKQKAKKKSEWNLK